MSKTAPRRRALLPALLLSDVRLLSRHGILWVYLLVGVLYVTAMRLMPASARAVAQPLLLFADPAAMSLLFMGAMVLYEKTQHVHAALRVSRMRPGQYLLSKLLVMAVFGAAVGVIVAALGGAQLSARELLTLGLLLLAGGVLFTAASLVAARFTSSLNGFLLLVVPVELVFLLPAVWDLFSPLPGWAGYHPGVLLLRLLADPAPLLTAGGDAPWGAAIATGLAPLDALTAWLNARSWLPSGGARLCYQLLALLGWLLLVCLLARRAVSRMLTLQKEVQP